MTSGVTEKIRTDSGEVVEAIPNFQTKEILSVEDYVLLIHESPTNPQSLALLKQKLFSKVDLSPLGTRGNLDRTLRDLKLKKFQSLEQAMTVLLPECLVVIGNLHNFLEAFLLVGSLATKRKLFVLFKDHFNQGFNFYHYLETAALIKRNMIRTRFEESGPSNEASRQEMTPEYLGDLIGMVAGLEALHLGGDYIARTKQGLRNLKTRIFPILPAQVKKETERLPENSQVLEIDSGGSILVAGNGIGFFANCLLAATTIGESTFAGTRLFDVLTLASPRKLDWLADWRMSPLNRFGLPFCLEGLTATNRKDNTDIVVFPLHNGLPLVLFLAKGFLADHLKFANRKPIEDRSLEAKILAGTRKVIAAYQARPCLEDTAYPSGIKLMEALLMFDQERYRFKLPDSCLALANLGSISLPRRGLIFEFKPFVPAEKKIYELGIRRILFNKPENGKVQWTKKPTEDEKYVLASVEILIVGEVKVCFALQSDGSLTDLSVSEGAILSAETSAWLKDLGLIYLGCLEQESLVIDKAEGVSADRIAKDLAATKPSTQPSSNFRVMSGNLPDHHGQWLDPNWDVNVLLLHRLGVSLKTINELFLTLQTFALLSLDSSGYSVGNEAMRLSKTIYSEQAKQNNLATLLVTLWFRAKKQEKLSQRERGPSARLVTALKDGLLGKQDGLVQGLGHANYYTVTFVQEPEEDSRNTQPVKFHLPEVATAVLG